MPTQAQVKERPERKPLPPPNTDFYEVTETLNAEEVSNPVPHGSRCARGARFSRSARAFGGPPSSP